MDEREYSRRLDDPEVKLRVPIIPESWDMVVQVVFKYGLAAAIGCFLVYHSVTHQDDVMQKTLDIVEHHRYESAYVQHSSCISLAVLAGTPKELCEAPREEEHR